MRNIVSSNSTEYRDIHSVIIISGDTIKFIFRTRLNHSLLTIPYRSQLHETEPTESQIEG